MNQETGAGMNDIPDVALKIILSYMPLQSFLPICHVSHRFHRVWIELKQYQGNELRHEDGNKKGKFTYPYNETNPLAIGNLFATSWHHHHHQSNKHSAIDASCGKDKNNNNNSNILNKQLLAYYIDNGFGSINPPSSENTTDNINSINQDQGTSSTSRQKNLILKKVMLETASRGDIEGMWFMSKHKYFPLDDEEICCTAGAAGHLEALKWLRGDLNLNLRLNSDLDLDSSLNLKRDAISKEGQAIYIDDEEGIRQIVCCPWDPTEVHREAAENSHDHVLEYVEKNCEGHEIQMSYGVGLPW